MNSLKLLHSTRKSSSTGEAVMAVLALAGLAQIVLAFSESDCLFPQAGLAIVSQPAILLVKDTSGTNTLNQDSASLKKDKTSATFPAVSNHS